MRQSDVLMRFQAWMLSTDRMESTIALRMRHVGTLARQVDLLHTAPIQLERLMAASRHLASETRKSMLASWRLFYGWALRRGLIMKDPTLALEGVRVRVRMPRLAPDDVVQLALVGASSRDQGLILLARFACLRLSELTALHTDDREHDVLRIRGKGDKERIVYINDDLMRALLTLEREQGPGYYFPGAAGGHLHPMSVNKIIRRVTGCNPHSLRHAGATAAYRATLDVRAVQEMLGHSSLATTQRYLHLDEAAKRRVAAGTMFGASSPGMPIAA